MVIAKTGSRNVNSIILDQREWLSIVACVNAAGQTIPNFYILKRVQFRCNYIECCEDKASTAMARKAWMSGPLFYAWLSHFIARIRESFDLSPTSRHLLVLDGHNSHVTLEVIHKVAQVGIDMVTLPSHISHVLQPLDVSIFAPFKKAFRLIRDEWVLNNGGRAPAKEDLAEWIHKGLKKASTEKNIRSGFRATSIYPLQPTTTDNQLGPSEGFQATDQEVIAGEGESNPNDSFEATCNEEQEDSLTGSQHRAEHQHPSPQKSWNGSNQYRA
jgi:hypothetical protein